MAGLGTLVALELCCEVLPKIAKAASSNLLVARPHVDDQRFFAATSGTDESAKAALLTSAALLLGTLCRLTQGGDATAAIILAPPGQKEAPRLG